MRRLRAAGVEDGLVCDLACGSGVVSRALLDAGYAVFGLDLSRSMIRLARRAAPGARFAVGSFVDAELPPSRAVCCVGEGFSYLFDGRNGRAALRRVFRRVHAALEPGGLFLFDVAGLGRAAGRESMAWVEKDWAMFVELEESARKRELTRRITTFRKSGSRYRRHEELHRQRLYTSAEILADLRAAGFRARAIRGYGEQRFPRSLAGFVARRH